MPLQRLPLLVLVAAVLVAAFVLLREEREGHRLTILASEARYMRPGLEVRTSGKKIGAVDVAEATRAGTARVEVLIEDDAWPLPEGTTALFRWAGTIAFTNRYVELTPPAKPGPPLRDGGTLAGGDVTPTVELDEIAKLFDARTRRDVRALLANGAPAFEAARPALPGALDKAPPALEQARAVLADLGADREALGSLVRSADRLVHAVDASDPGVRSLLSDGATTLRAVASRTEQLEQTLSALPTTLRTARTTLADAEPTITRLDRALRRLAPGVDELQRTSRPLVSTLRTARDVVPQARVTLATLRGATPDLNPLLDSAPALLDRVDAVAKEGTSQLECLRPYTPEVAGLASNWVGFLSYGDDLDKYARVTGGVVPQAFHALPTTSAQWLALVPGQRFAFPQPPGWASGQPWFIPECGVGPESLDAKQDPEARR